MDMNVVQIGRPFTGSAVPETASFPQAVRTSSQTGQVKQLPQQQQQTTVSAVEKKQIELSAEATEETRQENLEKAAQLMAQDIFVVSDMRFTIYKDLSGQFITRFTSLRDGSVTYIPEQDMNVYMESRGARRKALLQLDV